MGKTGSYTQLYVHIIFSTRYRKPLLHKSWRMQIFIFMKSFLENKGQKAIMINGVEDHVHLLISMNGTKSVSELMRDMKETTTKFINEKNLTDSKFAWQSGYSAFSLSKKSSSRVANYILNQEEHHAKEEFKDEYKRMLTEHEVIFREEYLFEDAPE